MTARQNQELDRVLRQWADNRAPEAETLDRLRQQVTASLDQEKFLDLQPLLDVDANRPTTRRAVWAAMATAAMVLIALAYLWFVPRDVDPLIGNPGSLAIDDNSPQRPRSPSSATLGRQQLEGQARLLAEMERMFDKQLLWVAETDGQVRLGLQADANVVDSELTNGRPVAVAVRLVVVRRRDSETDWTTVWQADLVSRDQQVIQLAPADGSHGPKLLVWAYALPDGMIAVDSELALEGPVTMLAKFSGVHQAGVPIKVHSTKRDDVEYEVFQTVELLNDKLI